MNTVIAPFKALHVGTQNTTAKEPQRTQMWHTRDKRKTFVHPCGVSHLYLPCVLVILLVPMKILFKVEKYEAKTIETLSDLMRDADLTGNPQVNITHDIEMHHHLTVTLQYSGSI